MRTSELRVVGEVEQRANAAAVRKRLMGGISATVNIAERKHLHGEISRLNKDLLALRIDNRNLLHAISEKDQIILAHEQTINSLTDSHDGANERRPAKDIIMQSLEDFPTISYAQIMGASRSIVVVEARHACIYALHLARPDLSLPQIGKIFGGRDHTSIIHAIRKMEKIHEQQA